LDKAANKISVQDIVQLKSLSKPPDKIKQISDALLHVFGYKNKEWLDYKKMTSNPVDFVNKIKNFDKAYLDRLMRFPKEKSEIESIELFEIKKASMSAFNLCSWIKSLYLYAELMEKSKNDLEDFEKMVNQATVVKDERDSFTKMTDMVTEFVQRQMKSMYRLQEVWIPEK
jgi:hypothetical protein